MYPPNRGPELFPAEFSDDDEEPDLLEPYEHVVGIEPVDGVLVLRALLSVSSVSACRSRPRYAQRTGRSRGCSTARGRRSPLPATGSTPR